RSESTDRWPPCSRPGVRSGLRRRETRGCPAAPRKNQRPQPCSCQSPACGGNRAARVEAQSNGEAARIQEIHTSAAALPPPLRLHRLLFPILSSDYRAAPCPISRRPPSPSSRRE